MRVLQITAFSGWGCTGRIALGIHNELVSQGNDSSIAWGRINTAPDNVSTIKIGNSNDQKLHGLYTRLTDKCGFASKKVTRKFLSEVDAFNPDLIQLHILHGYYINLELLFQYIKERDIPVVWTFHDCWAFTGHCPYFDLVRCEKWKTGCHACVQKKHHPTSWILDNSEWNWNKKKALFTGVKNMTIVTPSKWLAGLVKQSFLKEYPVRVINNGINTDNFQSVNSQFREIHGLIEKKIVLGVSSTWSASKGLDDFIALSKKLPENYIIVLVGLTKKQKELLPDMILGIERTDSVKELAEIYTAADVFVNPTYEDNYPTTNLEAMSCGTPVITYSTGGSVEIVEQTGFGQIVEQGNVDALCETIITLSSTLVQDVKVNVSENSRCRDYVELYQKILKGENIYEYSVFNELSSSLQSRFF